MTAIIHTCSKYFIVKYNSPNLLAMHTQVDSGFTLNAFMEMNPDQNGNMKKLRGLFMRQPGFKGNLTVTRGWDSTKHRAY